MRTKRVLLAATITLAPLSIARAGDENNLNERVDAAACQTRQSSDRSKLAWTGSDWAFAAGAQGTVVPECPIATTDTRYSEELLVFAVELDESQHFVRVVMRQGSNDGTNRVRFTRVRLFVDPPG